MTSSIQTQLNNCAPKANPTFTGTVSIPGASFTAVLNFPSTMTLATDLSGARIVLWPRTGNEWYGFGMNAYTLNDNVTAATTHKFYCGTTVYASISSTTTTINNTLTLASSITLSDSTVLDQTMLKALATNSTTWLKQATTLSPVYYNTGRRIILGCDSANRLL